MTSAIMFLLAVAEILPVNPIDIVTKAAASDRWAMFAAITMMIGGLVYLVREGGKRDKEHHAFMLTVYTEGVKLTAQVLVVLQENNVALKDNCTALKDCSRVLERVNERCDREDSYNHRRETPPPH